MSSYGKEELERMINSEDPLDRYEAAEQGYGLEQLINGQ